MDGRKRYRGTGVQVDHRTRPTNTDPEELDSELTKHRDGVQSGMGRNGRFSHITVDMMHDESWL
jgi:hypothetical protein